MKYISMQLISLIPLFIVSTNAYSQGELTLKIIDYGVYNNTFNGQQIPSNLVAGVHKPSHSMELVEKTRKVDGTIGTAFGFRFRPKGMTGPKTHLVDFCGEHPPMQNPATGSTATKECFSSSIKPNKVQWHTFVIENDWEIVPGDWTLSIRHKGKILAEKTFNIQRLGG